MLVWLNHKIIGYVGRNHSECSALQLTNNFMHAQTSTPNITLASLIAAIPCARATAKCFHKKWKEFLESVQVNRFQKPFYSTVVKRPDDLSN